jgi:lipopolysaccharide transport system permease protein
METRKEQDWKEIIRPSNNLLSLNLKELWEFRDLLLILTRRDITAIYKQTILGPLWFFLQPALTTLVYILVFSKAGKLSTGNLPPVLFYVSGLVLWMYFADCVLKTAGFLKENTAILSKVYFPRLIIPISIVMTNLIKLGIQLLLFFLVYVYFLVKDPSIKPNIYALLFPALTFVLGLLGLATGILVSSLTTRYKDLSHLITFAIQLLMFASPVIFPISAIENETARLFIQLNPVSGIIEAFRFGFLGGGYFSWSLLAYDTIFTLALSFFSILCFNAVEKKFVDTI